MGMQKNQKNNLKGMFFSDSFNILHRRRIENGIPYSSAMKRINAILDKKMGKADIMRTKLEKANNSFHITCEEVQSNLETYWQMPTSIRLNKIGQISSHLKECIDCQGMLFNISES